MCVGGNSCPVLVNLLGLGVSSISCIKDSSYSNLHAPEKNVAQFKFNAFSFLKSYDVVYLQCKVAVCHPGDHSSRCSQGCPSRGRREAEVREEQTEYFQTVGPLKIHREAIQSKALVWALPLALTEYARKLESGPYLISKQCLMTQKPDSCSIVYTSMKTGRKTQGILWDLLLNRSLSTNF